MEKTPPPPPPPPVSSPGSAEQSVSKPRSVESLQAESRRDRSRDRSRINLGQAFPRWRELRRSKGFRSDPEFASFLLDRYQGIKHVSRVHKRTRLMPDALSDGEIDASDNADVKQPAEIEINLGLTRSVREKTSLDSQERLKSNSEDVQSRLSASDEEESCSLSGSNHVVLTKEVLVLLMYRCLECSGPCRIWGLGKGGSLSFGQECVKCSHYRVWTSRPAVQPTQKVTDKSQTESHDSENRTRRIEACVNTDARDVSRLVVKEEPDEDERTKEEHVPPLLLEAHEDGGPSAQEADGSDLGDGPPDMQVQGESIDDRNGSVNDDGDAPSDEEYEDPSSSCEATENEGLSGSEGDRKPKPFQNTIKPVIWCTDCQCVAKMVCTIRRHLKIFGCRECGVVDDADRSTEDAPDVDEDDEKKHEQKNFSVYFGDVVSFHKHAMSTHGAKENPVEQRVCQDCNKIIRVKKKVQVHVCEYKIKPFFCPLCPKRFFTENGRKVHVRRLHGDYTHFCKFCMTPFATKASKLEHERRHGDADLLPFSCPDCPEKFKDFITRNQHMRGHTGQNRFICDACYRTLPTLTSYERHMRIHSGEKPYSCAVCERSFNQAGHLKSHMRLHTGERPFMCEQCGECFNHNVSLKNHLQKRHAGLAPAGADGSSETPRTGRGRKRDRTSADDPAEKMETEEGYRSQSEPSDEDECPKRGRKTKVRTKRRAKNNLDKK